MVRVRCNAVLKIRYFRLDERSALKFHTESSAIYAVSAAAYSRRVAAAVVAVAVALAA